MKKTNLKFIPKNKNLIIDFDELKEFFEFKYAGEIKENTKSFFLMEFKNGSFSIKNNGELEFQNINLKDIKDIYFVLYFRYWIAKNLKILNKRFKYKLLPKKIKKGGK